MWGSYMFSWRNQCTSVYNACIRNALACTDMWRTKRIFIPPLQSYANMLSWCWVCAFCHTQSVWLGTLVTIMYCQSSLSAFNGLKICPKCPFLKEIITSIASALQGYIHKCPSEGEDGGCNNHPMWEWLVMAVDNVLIIICLRTNLTNRRQCYRLWSSIYLYMYTWLNTVLMIGHACFSCNRLY